MARRDGGPNLLHPPRIGRDEEAEWHVTGAIATFGGKGHRMIGSFHLTLSDLVVLCDGQRPLVRPAIARPFAHLPVRPASSPL